MARGLYGVWQAHDSGGFAAHRGLPIGLAHGIVFKRDVKKDQGLSWADVEYSEKSEAVAFRREMEAIDRDKFRAAGRLDNVKRNGANGT